MKYLARAEKAFIAFALIAATIILFVNVVMRKIGSSSVWAEEAIRYIMIWMTFIGSAVCFREGAHFGVDIILRVPNQLFQKCVVAFVLFASMLFCWFELYYGMEFMLFAKNAGQITAALRMPAWIVYLSIPVGAVLSLLHLLEVFFSKVIGIYKINN